MSEVLDAVNAKGQVAYDASNAVVFAQRAQRALANAKDFTVDSQELLDAAGDDLRAVKTLAAQVEEQRTSITVPLNTALKAVNDLFRPAKTYLDEAERVLKGAMVTYTDEQARIAREARQRAEEEARKERERLDAERREQERLARVAAEQAAAAQREAAEATARGDAAAAAAAEEAQRKASAAAAAAEAQAQAAEVTAAVVAVPPAAEPARKVAGISTSKTVDFEVNDLHALVKHIAEHPELLTLVTADAVKLRAYVRSMGLNTKLPGVRVFDKTVMAARGR
jgi:colicin import membrane protein